MNSTISVLEGTEEYLERGQGMLYVFLSTRCTLDQLQWPQGEVESLMRGIFNWIVIVLDMYSTPLSFVHSLIPSLYRVRNFSNGPPTKNSALWSYPSHEGPPEMLQHENENVIAFIFIIKKIWSLYFGAYFYKSAF